MQSKTGVLAFINQPGMPTALSAIAVCVLLRGAEAIWPEHESVFRMTSTVVIFLGAAIGIGAAVKANRLHDDDSH